MKRLALALLLMVALAVTTYQQKELLQQRATVLKLGPVPNAQILKALAGEHRVALAFRSVVRVMFYFGSFFEPDRHRLEASPTYANMYRHIENAVRIDPYNMDAYYFSQAAFTWEIGHARDVNKMLEYGMQYRTWDYLLPFYAGFNAAYFLQDYASAARYMQKAAELSGHSLFTRLAARYFHEAGEAELGLVFLETMRKGAQSSRVRQIYEQRIQALKAVRSIEEALARFAGDHGFRPEKLAPLVERGYLQALPEDPYGGQFYLDKDGQVRSTSKFAMRSSGMSADDQRAAPEAQSKESLGEEGS